MNQYTALFDANTLYPAALRDVLLTLAANDMFQAKWTADIQREWIGALLRNQPHLDRSLLERTRDLMNLATRDCLVTGYETMIPALTLPDPDDRHVLAAAIVGKCDVIVSQNKKDFPEEVLKPLGIELLHPDDFLSKHLALVPFPFCSAIKQVRARLKKPPYSADEYLAILARQGLVETSSELERFKELI